MALAVGSTFVSLTALKDAVMQYCMEEGFTHRKPVNNHKAVKVVCTTHVACPFTVWGFRDKNSGRVQVTTFVPDHASERISDRQRNASVASAKMLSKIARDAARLAGGRADPKMIQQRARSVYGVHITYNAAWRAMKMYDDSVPKAPQQTESMVSLLQEDVNMDAAALAQASASMGLTSAQPLAVPPSTVPQDKASNASLWINGTAASAAEMVGPHRKAGLTPGEKMMVVRAHEYFTREKALQRAGSQNNVRDRVHDCLGISTSTIARIVSEWKKHQDPEFRPVRKASSNNSMAPSAIAARLRSARNQDHESKEGDDEELEEDEKEEDEPQEEEEVHAIEEKAEVL